MLTRIALTFFVLSWGVVSPAIAQGPTITPQAASAMEYFHRTYEGKIAGKAWCARWPCPTIAVGRRAIAIPHGGGAGDVDLPVVLAIPVGNGQRGPLDGRIGEHVAQCG